MKGRRLRLSCHWLRVLGFILLVQNSDAQITVNVINENREPLIGVHVFNGAQILTTDIEGTVILTALDENNIVTFEYIGYEDLNVSFGDIAALNNVITMSTDNLLIEEVIIIGRTNAREIDLPYNISRIKSEEIFSANAQSSADAIALNNGAYIQKSQMGGGSPVLRGFEANKVLMVVDGVRMNNAIYRNGHLQNAITVDADILDQMEVIFGAGSLLYGSEALGGVIHFRTKSPLLNFDPEQNSKQKFGANLRYNSSNQEKRIHLDHTFSKRNFGILTSVTVSDFGDLRMGKNRRDAYPNFGLRTEYVETINGLDNIVTNKNPNVQIGTSYSQYDLLQKYVFKVSDRITTELNLQYSNSSNIPRYDNLAEIRNGSLRFAEWYYGPQQRLLIAPKLTADINSAFCDKISLITSFQKVREDRISRRLNNPQQENQNESVKVLGVTLDFQKRLSHKQKLSYGVDFHHNDVSSSAFSINNGNEANDILSRYPDGGSQLQNFGTYVQHNLQNQDSTLIWINGLRWTTQKVEMLYSDRNVFRWPEYFYEGVSSTNNALVGISGLNFSKDDWLIKASTGTSFRSPNVDDLAKIRVNGDEITIPNTDLNSEKVWNSELTIGRRTKKYSFGVTGYYTKLKDAIVRQDFTLPDGSSTYIVSGDTLQVTANTNAVEGTIRGISVFAQFDINEKLNLYSAINFQKGTVNNEDGTTGPLGHIPPTFGRTTLNYSLDKLQLSLNWRYNGWKNIEDFGGSVDNPDQATPDGSPSWHVLGLNAMYHVHSKLRMNLGIDNLLDTYYRPFSSGLSAPGRHVVVALKFEL